MNVKRERILPGTAEGGIKDFTGIKNHCSFNVF